MICFPGQLLDRPFCQIRIGLSSLARSRFTCFHVTKVRSHSASFDVVLAKKKNPDFITNTFPRTFPKGQSVEIIKSKLLKKNITKFNKSQKEHVTKYFYENCKNFKIFNIKSKKNFLNMRLCVDTKKDLIFLNKNLKKLENKTYI